LSCWYNEHLPKYDGDKILIELEVYLDGHLRIALEKFILDRPLLNLFRKFEEKKVSLSLSLRKEKRETKTETDLPRGSWSIRLHRVVYKLCRHDVCAWFPPRRYSFFVGNDERLSVVSPRLRFFRRSGLIQLPVIQ
jgi:hypothetical protein